MRRNLLEKCLVKCSVGRKRIKGEEISEISCEETAYRKGVAFGISLELFVNAKFGIRSRLSLYLGVVNIFSCLYYGPFLLPSTKYNKKYVLICLLTQ